MALHRRATTSELVGLAEYIEGQWIDDDVFTHASWTVFRQSVRTNNDVEDMCRKHFLSGPDGVADSSLTASSTYKNNSDPKHDYGPSRGRLNVTEVKDASGMTLIGGWSADKNDVHQFIEVKLQGPTVIRGVVTQGRNGCCKQWVTKYRVLYSHDCVNWKPVGGPNTNDAFFKGNSDADTPEAKMFQCPVVAMCVRINPLEWNNHISLRFDLLGCPLHSGNTSAKSQVTIATGSGSLTPAGVTAPVITPVPGTGGVPVRPVNHGVKRQCVKQCKGMAPGVYQSCDTCDGYVTCVWGFLYRQPCPPGLKWNDNFRVCDFSSTTCP
ncbi:inactive carboxypeptidase-like protein X2 [Mizuhopecten yessoensis]|uniref:inactive carboxypeptidase-like protein X2 n=1 Tax=Mizuhopecten yessoensis TaxID=6573 RepID=UPI000B45BD4D|nr:inactive carboxypeptidase-like protein X2 [Mizuhopecten yessoensis]